MDKISSVDMIGFDVAELGIVQVRIAKTIWLDGQIISRENHRADFLPDTDVDAHLEAINTDLLSQGFSVVSEGDMEDIRATVTRRRTPERIANYEAQKPQMPPAQFPGEVEETA